MNQVFFESPSSKGRRGCGFGQVGRWEGGEVGRLVGGAQWTNTGSHQLKLLMNQFFALKIFIVVHNQTVHP